MKPILNVENLTVSFTTNNYESYAVNNISFELLEGEILAIAGESGSGKTISALSILNLIEKPGYIKNGKIIYKNKNLLSLPQKELEKIRGKEISIIFQEPSIAYDNFFLIGDQFYEFLKWHLQISKKEAKNIALNWLKKVNLNNPELIYNSYPFQLSGGMQQRVMIAMALACNPSLLIADEPTSSLDVISQNAILQMLLSLKDELNLSLIIISHDFSIIAQFATRILIMYKGRIVESSSKYELFDSPLHPYTKYLLSNLMDFKTNSFPTNQYIPKLIAKELTTSGCPFFELCQNHMNKCYNEFPSPFSFSKSHTVWCWLFLK